MEGILLFAFVVVAVIVLKTALSGDSGSSQARPSGRVAALEEWTAKQNRFNDCLERHQDLLRERFELGKAGELGDWYAEEPTERQLDRLESEGGSSSLVRSMTRGQVSDFIGMFVKPTAEELEVPKLLKAERPLGSQTEARHLSFSLLLDPENKRRYEERPLSRSQREMLRFLGVDIPRGAKAKEIESLVPDYDPDGEADWTPLDDWDQLESFWDSFQDREERECYEIKKPSRKAFLEAAKQVYEREGSFFDSDPMDIAEQLIENDPDLHRYYD